MSDTGVERALGYVSRLMGGETLTVPGLVEEQGPEGVSEASVRRTMRLIAANVPGVTKSAGRPALYAFQERINFCPYCGKSLPCPT